MDIRPVRHNEVARFRELRLAALRNAPEAFGSVYESEVDRPLDGWIDWLSSGLTLIAEDPDGWHGIVVGKVDSKDRGLVHVYSMWVEPKFRRAGLGRRLLEEVTTWAWGSGAQRVRLATADGNDDAFRLYRSYGFVPTGECEPLRSDPSRNCAFLELIRADR